MTEEEKNIEKKNLPWRFWFSAVLSAFLVVTFVYYLPLRFFLKATLPEMHTEAPGIVGIHKEHGSSIPHEEADIKEGLVVNFNASPMPVRAGDSAEFSFYPSVKPGNVPVPLDKLELEHTKLMHVVGVRDDMNEFFHIHPSPSQLFVQKEEGVKEDESQKLGGQAVQAGIFSVDYTFQKPGRYKLWSQVTKDGVTHTFGHKPIIVEGAGERSRKEVSFGRNVIVGEYQVALKTDEPFVKGRTHELSFDIHTLTSQEIGVESYLGADMHLAIIKDDWSQFIHTHPETEDHSHTGFHAVPTAFAHGAEEESSAAADQTINFHIVFPDAGLYRAYAQFRPKGIDLPADEALTATFWLKVEEKASLPIKPWWMLLFASSALIVILGTIVKKYLKVQSQS